MDARDQWSTVAAKRQNYTRTGAGESALERTFMAFE